MSIATRINAIEEHIGNAYNKLEDLGIDLTNIDKNINNIAEMLDTVYEDYPKVPGQGTEITLDGTKVGKLSLDVKGNSTQETTTGKNMYEGSQDFSGTWTNNNSWATDGTYNGLVVKKRTGQWEGINKPMEVVSGETYIYSLYVRSDANRTVAMYLLGGTATVDISSKEVTSTTSWKRVSLTFTATSNGTVKPRLENINVVANNYTYICGYQLEKGSTMTDYEPYTYGASPNPNYPQPILSSGDNGSISEKIVNKNLWTSEWEQGSINSEGRPVASSSSIRTKDFIYFKPLQHYAITRNITTNYINVRGYDINKNYIGAGSNVIGLVSGSSVGNPMNAGSGGCVIYTLENVYYLKFNDLSNDLTTKYMMVKGDSMNMNYAKSEEQTYTIPTQQPMRSIGTVGDEFIKVNGEWKERHNIGKVVLNGEETWTKGGASTSSYSVFQKNTGIDNNTENSNLLCNHFTNIGYTIPTTAYEYNNIGLNNADKTLIRIWIAVSNLSSNDVTGFRNWLSTHNTEVIYELATPTDLPCTAEQIAILENLPKSYIEQTNIYSLDVTPAYIEAKALKGE